MPIRRSLGRAAIAGFMTATCALGAAGLPAAGWVASWACSPQLIEPQNRPPRPGLEGNTLRQVVRLTVGGPKIRLRLSNEFGAQEMTLDAVHVALPVAAKAAMVEGSRGGGAEGVIPTTGAIRLETEHLVLFGGKPSVTIQPGAFVISDPVALPVAPLSDLAVTFSSSKMPDGITGHPGSRATSFLATGDVVSAATLPNPVSFDHWYVLDGVDVGRKTSAGSVVALGDSITDGRGSITNGNTRWADFLARRLSAEKPAESVGVLNEGIGGNCILRGGLGPTALSRFDRDVIGQTAVKWVMIFEGVNDIGGARGAAARGEVSGLADEVILALEQFIVRAHAHGIRAYGVTITPFGQSMYSSVSSEADRTKINDWIRTSGTFDAVVDFDKAVRNPAIPTELDAAADSGDHLHLSSEGYRRMAGAIDLELFKR